MTVGRRLLAAALLAACVSAAGASAAPGAPPEKDDNFVLRKGRAPKPSLIDRARELGRHLDTTPGRPHGVGVQRVLADANRRAGHRGGCIDSAFPSGLPSNWYCFTSGDANSPEWWPQGVTGVSDAQNDELWGSAKALVISSYDACSEVPKGIEKDQCKRDPGGTHLRNAVMAPEKGVRLTFFNPATDKYRHVLLVYPYVNKHGALTYQGVGAARRGKGTHGGGIAWYGNYLYLAETRRGVRVFDTRYIFDLGKSGLGTTKGRRKVGLHGGKYYGFGYRYVMPQVDSWVSAAGSASTKKVCRAKRGDVKGPPLFSYVSVDRSQRPDVLVTGEYCNKTKTGRMATWPLRGGARDPHKGQPLWNRDGKVRANHTAWLPDHNIQGAVGSNGIWWFTRSRGDDEAGLLIKARWAGGSTWANRSSTPTAIGPEDLHCWRGSTEIWSVSEHPGRRVLYAHKQPACH